jgi:DNA recombination protein RmuC
MIFKARLTTKINAAFTINVPSSFAYSRRIGYKARMNEILFMVGDGRSVPCDALIGFGALALMLLLVIAIVIARSARAARNWRWRRRSAPTSWRSV